MQIEELLENEIIRVDCGIAHYTEKLKHMRSEENKTKWTAYLGLMTKYLLKLRTLEQELRNLRILEAIHESQPERLEADRNRISAIEEEIARVSV